jgi:hypothetical protein
MGYFCTRGGRFDAHSSNEGMWPLYYRKLTFITFFNAGTFHHAPLFTRAGLSVV